MADNFGSGVSRVLNPAETNYVQPIWQQNKPPLDSELNLMQQLTDQWDRQIVLSGCPSGFLGNETNPEQDFVTDASWSNWFRFGRQRTGEKRAFMWAVVNGWLVPVTGTHTGTPPGSPNDTDTFNVVTLDPPPANSGDFRIDYVFLEVWKARIAPDPSTANKPAASSIYRYGNVEGGYTFLADDIRDPEIPFETTQRVQVQYRIRVVTGLVGLASYPDGFDPSVVKAQGAATAPTSFVFENMRRELGDPGLWRAGDGTANSLGTVDGYTYAVPICAVFRRNSVPWNGEPSQNLNGGFDRNPTAVDRTGVKTFSTTPTLASDMTASDMTFSLASVADIPLPTTPATPVAVQIGDEILTYASITGTTVTVDARAQYQTRAETHKAGDEVRLLAIRPDGLFADQVNFTDILDLRHAVNPNGFDFQALLTANLDKLLRAEMRGNWKRTGAGPQGPFVPYQDKIAPVGTGVSTGITLLDGPDNIRQVFSDAASLQRVYTVAKPNGLVLPAQVGVTWTLGVDVFQTVRSVASQFNPGDVLQINISDFKAGLPGGDQDQVRFITNMPDVVELRIEGQDEPLPSGSTFFSVSPADPTPNQSMQITLGPDFPPGTEAQLYVGFHVMYGPGRGLSRRPGALHSVAYLDPPSDALVQQSGIPTHNVELRTAWTALWSRYRNEVYNGLLPVTAEAYADPSSKTVILSPFRRVQMPAEYLTYDGSTANPIPVDLYSNNQGEVGVASTTFTDTSVDFVALGVTEGMQLTITSSGPWQGSYTVRAVAVNTVTVDRIIPTAVPQVGLSYYFRECFGLMPMNRWDGAAVVPKWSTTDPLELFSGSTWTGGNSYYMKNIFGTAPRQLVPGWGAVRVPIRHQDVAPFYEGVNYMVLSTKGQATTMPASERNYVPYTATGTASFATFSTVDLNTSAPAIYNSKFLYGATTLAGMRHFTDSRGMGREGLELPPFYGIARLFAVYEASDYKSNGSNYNLSTRELDNTDATNLLRQDYDGPTFWIEIDEDGDSTFILNRHALDLDRSPVPITDFDTTHFVIEASIFGFDRGSFDLDGQFRLVLTRERQQANSIVDRYANIGLPVAGAFDSPALVVPAPPAVSDQILVNYSRTPYQGDAWGSQSNYMDNPYKPGPMTTALAYQVSSSRLDETNLTRPDQKMFEVLASVGFTTTLGTGRLSGDSVNANLPDFRNVGYEDPAAYPPNNVLQDRPLAYPGGTSEDMLAVSTTYLGCTESLPLGSLFRDKDFRGDKIGAQADTPFLYWGNSTPGVFATSLAPGSTLGVQEVEINNVHLVSGQAGDVIIHVDGEPANYSLLTNYRTNRGGSAFSGSGFRPGGECFASHQRITGGGAGHTRTLTGHAYLVRNTTTSVSSTEVSAGDELMLLITTSVQQVDASTVAMTLIGTQGTGEGYSAADIYRIEGHPLVRDNVRFELDPNTIELSPAVYNIAFRG